MIGEINMTRAEVLAKLEEIFVDLLDNEEFELTEDVSMDTLEDWDSLLHITLIASVEDEFKIRISSDDIPRVKKVDILIDVIMQEMKKC